MVCNKCGTRLLFDPDQMLVCPKCNSMGYLYSQDETRKLLKTQLKDKIDYFLDYCKDYKRAELIYILHQNRDNTSPIETFFNRFFSLTYGIGILLRSKQIHHKKKQRRIEIDTLNILFDLCNSLYLDRHHLYFTKWDAVRILNVKKNNQLHVKYTENWLPFYKRQILHGSTVRSMEFRNELEVDLVSERHYRTIILEEIIKKNSEYYKIIKGLDYLQNYLFHYPWGDYLKIGRGVSQTDSFIRLINNFPEKNVLIPRDKILIKKKIKDFIINNWISSQIKSEVFPIVIEIDNKWFLPINFFNILKEIYDIFSSKNRTKYAKYQLELGKSLENRVFHDLKSFNLDFKSPLPTEEPLIRFKDPDDKGFELFDVGAFNHRYKRFYVIECKNKIRINPSNFNPIKLNEYIRDEFNEFRDRDLPKIRKLLDNWNFHDYKIIPIFYNIVPLYGEFVNIGKFQQIDGIYVIQIFAEIGSIIIDNFKKDNASFYEIYYVPKKFRDIITGKEDLKNINYKLTQDLGSLLGQETEKYLLHTGTIKDLILEKEMSDIDIELDYPKTIISINIPPELREKFNKMNLSKNERVSVIVYRNGPYSQILILGKIWKL